jgi:hypothetical protein
MKLAGGILPRRMSACFVLPVNIKLDTRYQIYAASQCLARSFGDAVNCVMIGQRNRVYTFRMSGAYQFRGRQITIGRG